MPECFNVFASNRYKKAINNLAYHRRRWAEMVREMPRRIQAKRFVDEYMRLCKLFGFSIGLVDKATGTTSAPFLIDAENRKHMCRFFKGHDNKYHSFESMLTRHRRELSTDIESLFPSEQEEVAQETDKLLDRFGA